MQDINKLKIASFEKHQIYNELSYYEKNYETQKQEYKDALEKSKIKDIEIGLLKNNIYVAILNIYNDKVRPIILEKYGNKNIGDKRKEEICNIFIDTLEKEGIIARISLSLADYNWRFGTFYITIYTDKASKDEYNELYRFNFDLDTMENELVPLYVNLEKYEIIDDVKHVAKNLYNVKIEYTRTIKRHLDCIEEEKKNYSNYIDSYNYHDLVNELDLKCSYSNGGNITDYDYLKLI